MIYEPKPFIMEILTKTIGRFLFAIPFLVFGVFHFMDGSGMVGMVPGWVPGGLFWVYLTGIALIAAAISIMLRMMDYLAAVLLGILLLIFVLTIHLPAVAGGNDGQMPSLLKDLALAGAAWFYAGYAAKDAPAAK